MKWTDADWDALVSSSDEEGIVPHSGKINAYVYKLPNTPQLVAEIPSRTATPLGSSVAITKMQQTTTAAPSASRRLYVSSNQDITNTVDMVEVPDAAPNVKVGFNALPFDSDPNTSITAPDLIFNDFQCTVVLQRI